MNEFKKRLTELTKDKKKAVFIIIGVVLMFLLFLGEFEEQTETEEITADNTSFYASKYTQKAEKDLEKLLSRINGVGKVKVLVTLDSCYENVFAKGYKSDVKENENETQSETEEEYIVIKKGSNNEESLIVKVYEPTVKGVAVVAEGADDIYVKKAITETVCALYDISSAKVSVQS